MGTFCCYALVIFTLIFKGKEIFITNKFEHIILRGQQIKGGYVSSSIFIPLIQNLTLN